jgi:hypothetical protein
LSGLRLHGRRPSHVGRGIFRIVIFIVIIFVIVFRLGRELFRIVKNRLLINTRI